MTGLIVLTGCGGYLKPLGHPATGLASATQSVPADARARLHIFMMNGLTLVPHVYGSLNGVGDYLHSMGFNIPWTATHYWRWDYQDKIRSLHRQDPAARFALIGYSIGASVVHGMAQNLNADGIVIDLMVYLDGHSFIHNLGRPPVNVRRVVNIISSGPALSGEPIQGIENHRIKEAWHMGAPRHNETLAILARELAAAASTAPPKSSPSTGALQPAAAASQ